jgi:hypothetical protein
MVNSHFTNVFVNNVQEMEEWFYVAQWEALTSKVYIYHPFSKSPLLSIYTLLIGQQSFPNTRIRPTWRTRRLFSHTQSRSGCVIRTGKLSFLDIKFSLEYAQMFFKKTLHRFNSSNGFP